MMIEESKKPKVIKKLSKQEADQQRRLDHQLRMEKTLLKTLIFKHPKEAKEMIRELPVGVYN